MIIKNLASTLTSQLTPPWISFIPKFAYPAEVVIPKGVIAKTNPSVICYTSFLLATFSDLINFLRDNYFHQSLTAYLTSSITIFNDINQAPICDLASSIWLDFLEFWRLHILWLVTHFCLVVEFDLNSIREVSFRGSLFIRITWKIQNYLGISFLCNFLRRRILM